MDFCAEVGNYAGVKQDKPTSTFVASKTSPQPQQKYAADQTFEIYHDMVDIREKDGKIVEDRSVMLVRPATSDSANPWSTSATLPVLQEMDIPDIPTDPVVIKTEKDEKSLPPMPETPGSTTTLPVSPESERQEPETPEPEPGGTDDSKKESKETATDEKKEEKKDDKKKNFSKAEYKVKFLHFLVITPHLVFGQY